MARRVPILDKRKFIEKVDKRRKEKNETVVEACEKLGVSHRIYNNYRRDLKNLPKPKPPAKPNKAVKPEIITFSAPEPNEPVKLLIGSPAQIAEVLRGL